MDKPSPLTDLLTKLQQKYDVMGQDLPSYLDGLLHSDYLTYWDYIHLDTLLSLQTPKTRFPDETVFIIYHQITELYFRLVLWEIEQMTENEHPEVTFFIQRLDRIIRYFRQLESSFSIMIEGLDKDQFLKFRMALLPSSGFQSAQYRLIEICSTDLINLVSADEREAMAGSQDIHQQMEKMYWRRGATELASGRKTLTLKQFEQKYLELFMETGIKFRHKNLHKIYLHNFSDAPEVIRRLREFDHSANVIWPLTHLKAAGRYLHRDPDDMKATGGTNWQKYLPPTFQKIMFFPELWDDREKAAWGSKFQI